MNSYVLGFREIDKNKLAMVGGKGANLEELSRIEGIQVPDGFCVTTEAYKEMVGNNYEFHSLLDQLSLLKAVNRESIVEISEKIRKVIEGTAMPKDIDDEITRHLAQLGDNNAYAVRSSATAEDLPTASFAGQQDTYLNIIGKEAILRHVSRCWASLFTDRAVTYRIQNGFDHSKVQLSVVIQKMVFPDAAGIMFTADPISFNRKIVSIDASFGLGEALVSGLVNADNYKVRDGRIAEKKISAKKLAIYSVKEGGTEEKQIDAARQNMQTLTDEQILKLELIGRHIEDHFGRPQDIEWCLYENKFYIVQSRPITTLYPIPDVQDGKNHVYLSFGHQQMMTDAIKPLGLSFFELLSGDFHLIEAGGRLFVDIADDLASPAGQKIMVAAAGKMDPLMHTAIKSIIKRKAFMKSLARGKRAFSMGSGYLTWELPVQFIKISHNNDAAAVRTLMSRSGASIEALQQRIASLSGDELFSFIIEAHKQLKEDMSGPQSMGTVFAGVYAVSWINKKMDKWLGEKSAADTLSQSAPNNVTSEMGLALLDVADAVGKSIKAYLEKYGMRCSGEIDITRPRFSEQPTALIPMILSNIRNFEPNAHNTIFEQGLLEVKQKEQDILNRLEQLSGGSQKAKKTRKMISLLRNFTGYREYPKYIMIRYYWVFKQPFAQTNWITAS